MLSAIPVIGNELVQWVWGGFSVDNATLNRFYSFHYLFPFLLAALVVVHLLALHVDGWVKLGPKFLYMLKLPLNKIKLAFILPNFKANKRIGPHNEDILSILVGSLLGDCHAERLSNGGVRFRFKQATIHKEYIFWLHSFLKERGYCSNNLPNFSTQKSEGKEFGFYRFDTYSFSSLVWLYKLFYSNNKKKILPSNIENLLTPLALAIWIMDDGTWKAYGVRIATNCFTKQEVELLVLA